MKKVDLNKVFFKLKIDDVFNIRGPRFVVTGRIESGKISNDSTVLITDISGSVLKNTTIFDLEFIDRRRNGKNVTISERINIGIIFEDVDKEILSVGNYVVIE